MSTDLSAAYSSAVAQYDLAYQISPIILTGGIAQGAQGGLLAISSLLGVNPNSLDTNAAPRFLPLPGSSLISQSVGDYPFANQAVAANATIQQPLSVSLMMIAPVNQPGGYLSKLPTFTALQKLFASHNNQGGLYNVATPAFIYNDMIMMSMVDVTPEDSLQKQTRWQLDFVQPIVTQTQAQAAQNSLMQKITNGGQFTGPIGWSGNSSAAAANLTNVTGALQAFGAVLPVGNPAQLQGPAV